MSKEIAVSRRRFLTSTAFGTASMGIGLPGLLRAEAIVPLPQTKPSGAPILRLDRNESPYGIPLGSAQAILAATDAASPRYPKDEPTALIEAIAKRFGVEKEQILLGCGSTEILKMATETFCSPSGAAVVAEPTFEAVVNFCPLSRARAVKVPLTRDYKHDLPRMLDAAVLVGGFIFFCNPGNPSGTFTEKQTVEKFVRSVPSSVALLVDEAYYDYVDVPEYESCIRYVKEGLPVLVSRTFSKAYGMAGLRIGYAVGHKDLIQQMSLRRLPSNTNQLAMAAALAALQDDAFVARIRKLNSQSRQMVHDALGSMRLDCIPSQTNFVMIHLGRPAQPVIDALKERRVLVGRLFPSMPNHMRVTLGTAEEMKLFLREFKAVTG